MWNPLLLLSVLVLAPESMTVETLDGASHKGQIESFAAGHLVLLSDGERKQLPYRQLLSVASSEPVVATGDKAAVWMELTDGSQLQGTALHLADGKALLTLRDGRELNLKGRSILQARILSLEAEALEDFEKITDEAPEGDLLVIRRPSGALDQLEGVIHSLDAEVLTFEFDDEKIPVGREKIAGFRFFQPETVSRDEPVCRVHTALGNMLVASQLELKAEQLAVTLAGGGEFTVPMSHLSKLDFSSGNLVYLSDLPMESSQWEPYLSTGNVSETLKRLYRPRRDTTLTGKPLVLANEQFARGLAMHSRTEVSYRLSEPFRSLQALVGIDPAMGENGHVELVVLGDGKQIYRQAIGGGDDPRPLELDVTGVKRLTILVDFGEQLDIGDHLLLCNARLTK